MVIYLRLPIPHLAIFFLTCYLHMSLTLPMLSLLSSKTIKIFKNRLNPGLLVFIAEYSQMSTHVPGYSHFKLFWIILYLSNKPPAALRVKRRNMVRLNTKEPSNYRL